jgi:hypothetical protein
MSTAAIFESSARILASAWANVFPRTCTIKRRNKSQSAGGDTILGTPTNAYTSVPCLFEVIPKFGWQRDQGEKVTTTQKYNVFLPTRYNNAGTWTRITIDADTDYLVVDAVELEPAITLKPDSAPNDLGMQYTMVATAEG